MSFPASTKKLLPKPKRSGSTKKRKTQNNACKTTTAAIGSPPDIFRRSDVDPPSRSSCVLSVNSAMFLLICHCYQVSLRLNLLIISFFLHHLRTNHLFLNINSGCLGLILTLNAKWTLGAAIQVWKEVCSSIGIVRSVNSRSGHNRGSCGGPMRPVLNGSEDIGSLVV